MTGKQRVLTQLYKGPVTIADFDRQIAIDGGARITRLAARIQDLKDDGYAISRRMVKLGGSLVAEYRLIEASELPVADLYSPQQPPAPPAPNPTVAQAPSSRNAIDDDWDWKAA